MQIRLSGVFVQTSYSNRIVLRITYMLTFVIVVSFQLSLIAEFIGVQCRDTFISAPQKPTQSEIY